LEPYPSTTASQDATGHWRLTRGVGYTLLRYLKTPQGQAVGGSIL